MQVTLIPVSHGSKQPIEIQDALFSIGRSEETFADYGERALSFLSRRHARIFIENGSAYIADLGSRNGTRLNNQSVEHQPAQIKQGDEISFANTLIFEVNISYDTSDGVVQKPLPFSLTLAAIKEQGEHLVSLASFPFLVGSNSDNLLDPATAKEAKRFLSRRHAHFFVKGESLYLEDLGSTNGTYVNGERLEEEPREIANEDQLEFGSPHCAFRVALQYAGATQGGEDAGDQTYHTAFISAADSFLDIFCMEEDEPEEAEVEESIEERPANSSKQKKPGPLHRFIHFIQQLRTAFAESEVGAQRARWIAPLALICLVVLIAPFFITSDKQRIEELFKQKDYLRAAVAADGFLSKQPQRDDVHSIGLEALLKHLMPEWQSRLLAGKHDEALSLLDAMQGRTQSIEMSETLIQHLNWVTRLDRYMVHRGGMDARIEIFSDEVEIASLLDWWQSDSKKHRSNARIILDYHSEFEQINVRASSQLRALENEESVYLKAIEKLLAEINSRIVAGDAAGLQSVFEAYAKQYPRLTGLDELGGDLQTYLPIEQAHAQNDFNSVRRLAMNAEFKTPPFIGKNEQIVREVESSVSVGEQLQAAENAWRAGELKVVLGLWRRLAAQSGQGVVQAKQLHAEKRELLDLYNRLPVEPTRPDYSAHLNEFLARLDKSYDAYLFEQVSQQLQQHGTKLSQDADHSWQTGQRAWQEYRQAGGIGGLLRLEEEVSSKFIEQVERLNIAHTNVRQAEQVYTALGHALSADQVETRERVVAEIALQKRSLQQLSIVLGQELLDQKLSLFTEVDSN